MQCAFVTLRIRRDVREKMLKTRQILNKFTSKQFAVVSLFFAASIITVIVELELTPVVWIDSIRFENSFQLNAQILYFITYMLCVTSQIEQIFDKLIAFFNLVFPTKSLRQFFRLVLTLLRLFESFVRISIEIANCAIKTSRWNFVCSAQFLAIL